ncbi:OsmC family protein [Caldivirga maquilingensis]|uniref:OsmC family protein n=1 Tax=Caldivirga maquilingensis (strain ATCC 700844 / DSM 13496 / JCM 10307 / IC-167) TaxID=397948 RepID=A8MCC1_CALMQ|nr:OsmC family protein [Caldivirga maquilingensis]ABW01427.1 OsmC family protein [Caldivirga maquilingensis IC-167]
MVQVVGFNGLDLDALRRIVDEISRNPSMVKQTSTWVARTRWLGGFRVKAYVRNFTVEFDEPDSLGGSGKAPKPTEYILAALGACLTIGFILNATKRGVRVNDLEIALEGDLNNVLVFLGLSNEGHPGYREIRVKAYINTDAPENIVKELWEYTVKTSPVGNTLTNTVNLITDVKVINEV